MTEEAERRRKVRRRLWLAVAAVCALLALLLVPPYISISRYKSQITQLVARTLGRPVRMSSVEMRLLPWPGFVLTDLTVEEDPAYGAEPVLHANSVKTGIRLGSLWRGHLELSSISLDEASLNLVRAGDGRWNLDPLFRTAAEHSQATGQKQAPRLPYLEATNSRINFKNGLEKLPYSLVNADLALWQENSREWRLRLKGQPARTDVNLDLADTGIVRLEARVQRAAALRQMPLHVEMQWREAQLGQLSRLVLGADPGWRGDLTGQLQLDGTAAAAQVKTRLRATGVHRAEFAPADALDFDANCNFVYHYSVRSVEGLACDSPLGDGHVRLAGELPRNAPAKLSVAVDRVPVSAGLDMLRTLRNGIPDDVEARGVVSGELTYDPAAVQQAAEAKPARAHGAKTAAKQSEPVAETALKGSLTVEGFRLSGNDVKQPIEVAKIELKPAETVPGEATSLVAEVAVPAGAKEPLTVSTRLALAGYQLQVRGQAALPRLRELGHLAGVVQTAGLDAVAGDPATLDLVAEGPWLPPQDVPLSPVNVVTVPAVGVPVTAAQAMKADRLSGTISIQNANARLDALASPVEIAQATLRLDGVATVWDPVAFTYGPVKGTARVKIPQDCAEGDACAPQVDLHFEQLDAAALQQALLGAPKQGSVLTKLLERFSKSAPAIWPRLNGTLHAGTLALGPVKLRDAALAFKVQAASADLTSLDGGLLGGTIHATGTVTSGDKPAYRLEGTFAKVDGNALCQLVATRCTGGTVDGDGEVTMTGFSSGELSASTAGALHMTWKHGGVRAAGSQAAPKELARFDRWSFDVALERDGATLEKSEVVAGARKATADAKVSFGEPSRLSFAQNETAAKH